MELVSRLDHWFADKLRAVRCREDTRAYIVGVLSRQLDDMSDESIVLSFNDASMNGDFATFQRIGDWSLWASSFAPHPQKSQRELVEKFGRLSYYACHRIMHGKWLVYEELADELPAIIYDVRYNVNSLRIKP